MPLRAPPKVVVGRYALLVFRDGRFLRSLGAVKHRISVGSGSWCDIVLEAEGIPLHWGTITDRTGEVLVELAGGGRLPLRPFEPLAIGPFLVYRVPAGRDVEEAAREIEAGLLAGRGPVEEDHEQALEDLIQPEEAAPFAEPATLETPPPPPPRPAPRDLPVEATRLEPVAESKSAREQAFGDELHLPRGRRAAGTPVELPKKARLAMEYGAGASAAPAAPPAQSAPRPATVAAPAAAVMRAPAGAPKSGGFLAGLTGSFDRQKAEAAPDAAEDDAAGGDAGAEPLARRTTVRHYEQMNPGKTYPLLVIISAGKVERPVEREVVQVESETGFVVARESPMVRIEPVLPGCAVAPSAIDVDCTATLAEAKFVVTPIVEGEIPEARIEVRHEGKVIDVVPIPCRVAKQTIAKVSAAFSAVSPFAMQALRIADGRSGDHGFVANAALDVLHDAQSAAGGPLALGIALAAVAALVALVFYLKNRPKEGAPIVRFMDYSTALPAEDDLAVSRLKARLVILAVDARRLVPIVKRTTTIGRDPSCDVVLSDPSVAPRHAEVVFDGATLRIRAIGGAALEIEGRAVGEADLAKDDISLKVGRVALWFCREARDERLDAAGAAEEIVAALVARLPGAETEIRAAFAGGRPARGAAAELMARGKLDVPTWRQVASGFG